MEQVHVFNRKLYRIGSGIELRIDGIVNKKLIETSTE
jgi:hypothetical protein